MKKRNNSFQSASTTPTNAAKVSPLLNQATHNYLHMLKQSSLTHKSSKSTIPAKQDVLGSMLSSNSRGNFSSRGEYPLSTKLSLAIADIKPSLTPQATQKTLGVSLSLHAKLLNQKGPTKKPMQSVKASEGFNKLNENPYKKRSLSGSFCTSSDPIINLVKPQDLLLSPQTKNIAPKNQSLGNTDSLTTAGSSNDKQSVGTLNSSVSITNFDVQSTYRNLVSTTSCENGTSQFLSESFENYKNKTPLDETEGENDSKTEEMCLNHPHKKAKYYSQSTDDSKIQYKLCSKCAVTLADQGTKIREIISSESDLRKSEIEAFLIKLVHSKRNTNNVLESIQQKKQDIVEYYTKQSEKAEAIASVLERIIREELEYTKQSMYMQKDHTLSLINTISEQINMNLSEVNDMQMDIDRNLDNILRHIDIDPFKKIIGAYHTRLQDLDFSIEHLKNQRLEIFKLPGVKTKHIEEIKPSILAFFELHNCKTSVLKRSDNTSGVNVSKSSEKSQLSANKSSLYISFENKENFESACGSVFETQREPDRFSFACDQSEIIKAWRQEEDNKSKISSDSQLLETESTNRSHKSLQGRHNTKDSSTDSIKQTAINSSLLNEEKVPVFHADFTVQPTQLVTMGYEVCSSKRESYNSAQNASFVTSNFEGYDTYTNEISKDRTSEKYLNLIQKVNKNQKRKTAEYSSLLKISPMPSRQYLSDEDDCASQCESSDTQRRNSDDIPKKSVFELVTSPEKKISCNPFLRRKTKTGITKRKTKSHNSSYVIPETDELAYASSIISSEKKNNIVYRSPNFKENYD